LALALVDRAMRRLVTARFASCIRVASLHRSTLPDQFPNYALDNQESQKMFSFRCE
jgi:hypothetical protein